MGAKKMFIQAVGFQMACLATSKALVISLNPEVGMDLNALAGFQAAANYWQSQLADNVTVNIDVGFSALGPGILGSAGSSSAVFSAASVRTALINDATTANDAQAIGNLPALSVLGGLSFLTQVNSEGGSIARNLLLG
jgi:hypothetical protein